MSLGAFESLLVQELRKALAIEIASHGNVLIAGNINDWSSYKYQTGRVSGLRRALDAIDQIEERMLHNENRKKTA